MNHPTTNPSETERAVLRLPALEIRQGGHKIYTFGVDGKVLPSFATVSRVRRSDDMSLEGYQRPEVMKHIAEIRRYIESDNPLLPNAIVLAFDGSVHFEVADPSLPEGLYTRVGHLVIPIDETLGDADKPAWVVDGQQRMAAIRNAKVDAFPLCVTAFITGDQNEQTSQFILINNTKPLPKGLLYELLPGAVGRLPETLKKRQFASQIMQRLNFEPGGAMEGKIRMPTNPDGIIKDNSILKMLGNSLSDGVLYDLRRAEDNAPDEEAIVQMLNAFWGAVASVFPEAWSLKPTRSRLTHGAGIISLGFLMDAIAEQHMEGGEVKVAEAQFRAHLRLIEDVCQWTSGFWDFGEVYGRRRWNDLQNIPRDIEMLTSTLTDIYFDRLPD